MKEMQGLICKIWYVEVEADKISTLYIKLSSKENLGLIKYKASREPFSVKLFLICEKPLMFCMEPPIDL